MWLELRKDIEHKKKEQNITNKDFQAIPINQWKESEEKIYPTFCKLDDPVQKPIWLWEYFKLDTYAVCFNYNFPFNELSKLVNPTEKVWLFVNETINEGDKF